MASFNKKSPPRNRVEGGSAFPAKDASSSMQTTTNHEGRAVWLLDEKTELFFRATTAFAGQDTFYEKGAQRDARAIELVKKLAVEDFQWTADFLSWLRSEGNMRTMPLMLAVEAVNTRVKTGKGGATGATVPPPETVERTWTNRRLIDAVQQRGDEPGEMVAYCENVLGRMAPIAIRRGAADAVARLYNERSFLRYDSEARGIRFGGVIELAQMKRAEGWKDDLYRYAIAKQHGNDVAVPESLTAIAARDKANKMTPKERHAIGRDALEGVEGAVDFLRKASAGSWEWVQSWLGETGDSKKPLNAKERWQVVIPHMGIFALVRNLRNLDQAGFRTGDKEVASICARLAEKEAVAKSRMFPFRFFTAFLELRSVTWSAALEQAANHSLASIPELPGRTLVLVDTSASMERKLSSKSVMNYIQVAALFGTALKIKNPDGVNLFGFADGTRPFKARATTGHSLLMCAKDFTRKIGDDGHGTGMERAIRATYNKHDRVIIISDMQAFPGGMLGAAGWYGSGGAVGDVASAVPPHIPVYGFNLSAGSTTPLGKGNRHSLGGLTDATFRLIPQLEAVGRGEWPWENRS